MQTFPRIAQGKYWDELAVGDGFSTHRRTITEADLVNFINAAGMLEQIFVDADQGSADVALRTPLAPYEKSKFLGSGGSMVARLKLKGIDGRAPPGVEPAA